MIVERLLRIEHKRKSMHARNTREQEDLRPKIARSLVEQEKIDQSNATRLEKLVNKLKIRTYKQSELAVNE